MKLLADLNPLVGTCPGLVSLELGRNNSEEGFDHGFLYGLVALFSDKAALNTYLRHPDHVAFSEKLISKLATSPEDDILVFDVEVSRTSNQI